MRSERPRIVFVPLARNQTVFYVGVADLLRRKGIDCAFLSFHEPSLAAIREAGFEGESIFAHADAPDQYPRERALATIDRYGVVDPSLVISHERAAYEFRDSPTLLGKFASYLVAVETLLAAMARRYERVEVVHELGGFLSVAATFYAARRQQIRNTFIEPSFFRGRVFFTQDSYAAPRPGAAIRDPTPEMQQYLTTTARQKQIAIPSKDAAHYRSAVQKVASLRNMRRLVEKTVEKHLLGQREEFSYLGGHVRRHLRMIATARRLRRFYQELPKQLFVYYPLHVPADVSLTIRAPEYCDQYALIEYLARTLPPTHLLAVKEHPALIGVVGYSRVVDLIRRHDNIVLLRPTINNYDVLSAADAVVTVNSKSGAEALMLGQRVIVLGDAFYRSSGLVHAVDHLQMLGSVIRKTLTTPGPARADVERFFQQVWDLSWPGELYLNEPTNCAQFADSIVGALGLAARPMCVTAG